MYLLSLYLPLYSSICIGLFGRCIGSLGSSLLSSINIIIGFCLSLFYMYETLFYSTVTYINLGSFINLNTLIVNWELAFNTLSVVLIFIINTISMCVFIYSTSYMKDDPHINRFLCYLNLFTLSMLLLVTSNNLILLFIGWEGIGVVSYLLIGFWYTRLSANQASIKAILLNRIGDWGLTIGCIGLYEIIGSLDYNIINSVSYSLSPNSLNVVLIFIFMGAIAKSAQLGLHTWLYTAMEGPTPVSSLLHAATLVTAGVYLNLKLSTLLELNTNSLIIITLIGSITTLYGSCMGLISNDLKRIIAFSTMSQLGLMILSLGLSNYTVSLYHLFNHAFVKALLFLSAGIVIHSINNEQDLRKIGSSTLKSTSNSSLIIPYISLVIASLSLGGFPYLSCFYSKDIILETSYSIFTISSIISFTLGCLASIVTVLYSVKIIYYGFITRPLSKSPVEGIIDWPTIIPCIILIIPSIFIGYLTKEIFTSPIFNDTIYQSSINLNTYEFIPTYIKYIPLSISTISILLFNLRVLLRSDYLNKGGYNFEYIYNNIISRVVLRWSHTIFYKELDRGVLEQIGPKGTTNTLRELSRVLSSIHSGYVYHYIINHYIIIIGILITVIMITTLHII